GLPPPGEPPSAKYGPPPGEPPASKYGASPLSEPPASKYPPLGEPPSAKYGLPPREPPASKYGPPPPREPSGDVASASGKVSFGGDAAASKYGPPPPLASDDGTPAEPLDATLTPIPEDAAEDTSQTSLNQRLEVGEDGGFGMHASGVRVKLESSLVRL